MNDLEIKMLELLTELKNDYFAQGLKAEFEAEGASLDEVLFLKELATRTSMSLTIKIGGCEAIKDMQETKSIGIDTIVAPMIESPYAFKKFINAADKIFNCTVKKYINIETINGFNYLDEILQSPQCADLNGIVFGRTDMCGSLNLSSNSVNSNEILEFAKKISEKTNFANKEFVIGGGICVNSIGFLNSLQYLSAFETRKIIFNSSVLKKNDAEKAIQKALEFELLWLKNKNAHNTSDNNRIKILETRI